MNIASIRERLTGGFKPFSIVTSDGRAYAVPHPEFILLAPRSLAVVTGNGEITTLDPIHIVAIKDLPKRKNGFSKH